MKSKKICSRCGKLVKVVAFIKAGSETIYLCLDCEEILKAEFLKNKVETNK